MNTHTITVREIAGLVGGSVEGDDTATITSVAAIDAAGPEQITFATDDRRASGLVDSGAGAAIIPINAKVSATAPMALIRVDDVESALATLLGAMAGSEDLPYPGIDPTAVIAPDAIVAEGAALAAGVVIGRRAKIGKGVRLCANVVIGADVELDEDVVLMAGVVVSAGCRIGKRVRIWPNSVIGSDGFGYHFSDGEHRKIPHIGNVVIADDVEIGACSCVDRAKFGSTIIGEGTKVDNLVQIAHNVQIGRGCLLAGQAGIAGSTRLGNHVVIGGNAGIRDNVTLGNDVQLAAYSGVASDIPDGQIMGGTPAMPMRKMRRIFAAYTKLPELVKRIKNLEARLNAIEPTKDN